jgi:hypothetical protein
MAPIPVARFLLSAMRKSVPANVVTGVEQINGQPSVVYYPPDGKAGCVLTLHIADECIRNIYIVTNPEKLRLLPSKP